MVGFGFFCFSQVFVVHGFSKPQFWLNKVTELHFSCKSVSVCSFWRSKASLWYRHCSCWALWVCWIMQPHVKFLSPYTENIPTPPLQRSHKIAINQYVTINIHYQLHNEQTEVCKKAMMNINIGQKGEETWEWASGYDTWQHISPSADVQRNSRAEAEGKAVHCRPAGSEQAPVCFRRQNQLNYAGSQRWGHQWHRSYLGVNVCVHAMFSSGIYCGITL